MASKPTKSVGIRLTLDQLTAIEQKYPNLSLSLIVRALLEELLSGGIPQIPKRLYTERARTNAAVKEGLNALEKTNDRRKAECQLKKTPMPLRLSLRDHLRIMETTDLEEQS